MKKLIASSLLLLSIAMAPLMAEASKTVAAGTDAASATPTLIAAPGATKKLNPVKIILASSAAEALTLKCGSTTKFYTIMPANLPQQFTFNDFELLCGLNETLNAVKTTAGTNLGFTIVYDQITP